MCVTRSESLHTAQGIHCPLQAPAANIHRPRRPPIQPITAAVTHTGPEPPSQGKYLSPGRGRAGASTSPRTHIGRPAFAGCEWRGNARNSSDGPVQTDDKKKKKGASHICCSEGPTVDGSLMRKIFLARRQRAACFQLVWNK